MKKFRTFTSETHTTHLSSRALRALRTRGQQHSTHLSSRAEAWRSTRKAAFTLAEVLITLAIIGVVAAITIPSLMALIGSKSDSARKEVIEDRLLDGLNRYSAMEDGLSLHYNTTKEFLDGLSKYYKMSQICDSDEITRCVPYEKISYDVGQGQVKSIDVSTLTTNSTMMSAKIADNYLPPASFITAQGTPVIIALKKGCTWDMGTAMTNIQSSGCISLMYDKNGTGLPNKMGEDIVSMGLSASTAGLKTINGVKVMETVFFPQTGLTNSECTAEISKASEYTALGFETGITQCETDSWLGSDGDRWAAAMKYCKEKGYHLPSEEESLKLVQGLYKDASGNHPTDTTSLSGYTCDTELAESIGLKHKDGRSLTTTSGVTVFLWLGKENSSNSAYGRGFYGSRTFVANNIRQGASRNNTLLQAVCLGD